MTSIANQAPPKGTDSDIAWLPQQLQGLYRDWGKYCSRRHRESKAVDYFDKARNLKPDDYKTLYHSSQSKRRVGKTADALTDCRQAQKILEGLNTCKFSVNLETCDALVDLNQFENAKSELHHNTHLFSGNRRRNFKHRLTVVDENLKDTCGNALNSFELENEKIFKHVKELQNSEKQIDDRPLWKKLREQDKCDVLSIPEIEEELLSPLEIARRKRAFDICNQVYMNRSWVDVLFMNELRKNPNLFLKQCSNKEYIKKYTANQYSTVKHFLSMLNARSPMYNERYIKQVSPGFKEASLYRIQYQTRRDMMNILRTITEYRMKKNLTKLGSYVEEVMGDYVVLKTHRIMPWKFEFMNEVYNTYALALSEQYYVPKNFRPSSLLILLRHAVGKSKDQPIFVFGDRSTYLSLDTRDKKRDLLLRLENRMVFAKHSIEKCYLLHQIANIHLQAHRYEQCCLGARKATEESRNCNSWLWNLLATIVIIKSNATLGKIEATKFAIANALDVAEKLKCERLIEFFQLCQSYNERISSKSSVQSGSKRDSKLSISSSSFR